MLEACEAQRERVSEQLRHWQSSIRTDDVAASDERRETAPESPSNGIGERDQIAAQVLSIKSSIENQLESVGSLKAKHEKLKNELNQANTLLRFAQPSEKWVSWPRPQTIKAKSELTNADCQITEVEFWSRGSLNNISTLQFYSEAFGKSFMMGNSYYSTGESTKASLRKLTKVVVWQDGHGVGRIEFHDEEGVLLA